MLTKIITLRYPGHCADCNARLRPGDLATWAGRGVVYGIHCHADQADPDFALPISRCIDAPCCGCCGDGVVDLQAERIA